MVSGETTWSVEQAVAYGGQVLSGERLRLRGLREDDLPDLVRWWQDPELGVLQKGSVSPPSEAAARELFTRWSANQDGGAGFSIETLPTDDQPPTLVGHLSLSDVRPRTRSATFAIGLGPAHLGRGYGSEATRLAVRYGFWEMNLHRIQLVAFAFNQRAVAAYRSAGFREEGRRRDALFHDGRYHDEVLMSVLSTD
ncbi:N-acetyltransferase [Geodermatophilus sp. DF01-2]|uniref:GNAT family N-acetyltransferase n=1 Tax=Geodermatophilus sp. DF01-2 TaxID=2559610 RepID=UPI001074893E|nr:GNAT family protein [Geodermatophilus sp. DF01_2]TFV56462.1 N-acetyltransferase [Geodermatophilus sp. DF01_2]